MRGSFLRSGIAIAVSSVLFLGACSQEDIIAESAGQLNVPQSAVPNLDEARIEQMMKEVQTALDEADKTQDASLLSGRLSGPALTLRESQYSLAKASNATVPGLNLTPQLVTVTNSTEWPRVVLDVAVPEEGSLPHAFFYVQENPRSGYRLENWMRLLGDTEFTAYEAAVGSPYLPADSPGFIVTPKEAVQQYVDMLNAGTVGSDTFAIDEFTKTYYDDAELLNSSVEAAGTVTAQASTGDFPITSIATKQGTALVASAFTYSHTYDRTIARSTMKLGGSAALLAGENTSVTGTVTATYIVTILIEIPPEGSSQKAHIVGAERSIHSVSRDDNAKPEGE